MCASHNETRYSKNLGKPSGNSSLGRPPSEIYGPMYWVGDECGSCFADTCPLAHRPQPRAPTFFCRHSNVMRLVSPLTASTIVCYGFWHKWRQCWKVVVQQSPVTPIHIFFIGQICTRQPENSRSKQNDALRCRVTVLGVTDIRVSGSFFRILA